MQRRSVLFNLLAQIAFGMLLMTLCLPSMRDWGPAFQASPARVQLTFAGYVVAFGVMQLLYGPWSDRWGRKRVLMAGLSLACIGSLAAALAPSLDLLILARVLQGAGASAGLVIGRAMVQDQYQGTDRTRTMAYIGMAMGMSPPLATLLGGQLHQWLGWQAVFFAACGLGLLLLAAAAWGLPSQAPTMAPGTHWVRSMGQAYRALFARPAFVLFVAMLSFTYGTLFAFFSGAPMVLASYGVGPGSMGWFIACMTVSYIVGSFLTSRVVQRLGEWGVMAWGQAFTFAGVGLMLLMGATGQHVLLAMALPLILIGIGHGLLVPSTLAGSVSQLPAYAGAAAGVGGMMQQVMGGIGSYTVGWFAHDDSVNLAAVMLFFSLCALLAHGLLLRRRAVPAAP